MPAPGVSLSVLMPVYNERVFAAEAIERTRAADLGADRVQIVVIDDGSDDGTGELLETLAARGGFDLVRHPRNRGKGAALRTGLERAEGRYIALMDADLEYDPANLARLLDPVRGGASEAAFGTRPRDRDSSYSRLYVLGNVGVSLAASVLFGTRVTDIMTCLKVLPTDLLRSLDLRRDGFDVEAEITAGLLLAGARIHEVPISYRARRRADGKKLTVLDGARVIRTLVRCRLASR